MESIKYSILRFEEVWCLLFVKLVLRMNNLKFVCLVVNEGINCKIIMFYVKNMSKI